MEKVYVQLSFWKKNMKIACSKCKKKLKAPYTCEKCQIQMEPFVKMNFGG